MPFMKVTTVEHYPSKAPQRPAAHVVIRRVRSSLRAWASPACDPKPVGDRGGVRIMGRPGP
jgi:hypothetical protein